MGLSGYEAKKEVVWHKVAQTMPDVVNAEKVSRGVVAERQIE